MVLKAEQSSSASCKAGLVMVSDLAPEKFRFREAEEEKGGEAVGLLRGGVDRGVAGGGFTTETK